MSQRKYRSYELGKSLNTNFARWGNSNKTDLWLLFIWFGIGTILRFTNLGYKPASSIEIATIGFSLGNGFSQIPLDRLVSIPTLLSPLKVDVSVDSADVIRRLFSESTHPPLYFWLTHWWIKLFVDHGEIVSLQIARSLSAMFGGLSIPAIFGLSKLVFSDRLSQKHRLTAHFGAIIMAFSPYGIYLAQEARHYTLSILWIIASLSCTISVIKHLRDRRKIPSWIALVWIVINSLGIATHYFFSLALVGEGLILLGFWFWQRNQQENKLSFNSWLPVIFAILGTSIGCLVWLPVASNISGNELTDWIATDYDLDEIWEPIPRLLGWLITMVAMLPIEGVPVAIAICSIVVLLLGSIWMLPTLASSYISWRSSSDCFSFTVIAGYVLGTVSLYLLLIYGYGKDVSLAARYHFIYFPVIVLIWAAMLAQLWSNFELNQTTGDRPKWFERSPRKIVAIALIFCFLGSLTVVNDFGYKKSRQANRLARHIQSTTTAPAIVATTYETLSELRELVALSLAIENNTAPDETTQPQLLLLQRNENHDAKLNAIMSSQPKPLDLWGVNLRANEDLLKQVNCIKDDAARLTDSGYKNRVYHCR
ncbi:MAG: glycosyltransferase family 39 protein [Cyanobacteria bacterium P01_G01_bin.19]